MHKNAVITKMKKVSVLKGNYIQVLDRGSRSSLTHPKSQQLKSPPRLGLKNYIVSNSASVIWSTFGKRKRVSRYV